MADRSIAQAGEPAGLAHLECCKVTARDFDEDQLTQSEGMRPDPNIPRSAVSKDEVAASQPATLLRNSAAQGWRGSGSEIWSGALVAPDGRRDSCDPLEGPTERCLRGVSHLLTDGGD